MVKAVCAPGGERTTLPASSASLLAPKCAMNRARVSAWPRFGSNIIGAACSDWACSGVFAGAAIATVVPAIRRVVIVLNINAPYFLSDFPACAQAEAVQRLRIVLLAEALIGPETPPCKRNCGRSPQTR